MLITNSLALVFMLCQLLHVYFVKIVFIHFQSNRKVKVKRAAFENIKLFFKTKITDLSQFENLNRSQSQS